MLEFYIISKGDYNNSLQYYQKAIEIFESPLDYPENAIISKMKTFNNSKENWRDENQGEIHVLRLVS